MFHSSIIIASIKAPVKRLEGLSRVADAPNDCGSAHGPMLIA
jgi:hypothetical protein